MLSVTVVSRRWAAVAAVAAFVLCVSAPGAWGASSFFTAVGIGSMTIARTGAIAAPLPDGRVLIAGGLNGGLLSSAEVFDPANGTFSSAGIGSMTTARIGAIAAPLPDGRVLIAGGENGSGFLSSAEVFDPASGTFSSAGIGSMATARDGAVALPLPDGQVLIAGGVNNSGLLSTTEVFDPASGTFSSAGVDPPATASAGAMAAPLPDGRVLIAGGNTSTWLSSAEVFDPASGTFSSAGIGSMTTARAEAVAAPLPDGRVLIAGGENGSGSLSSAEVFQPAPQAAAAGGDFGDQTVGETSAAQTLVVTNIGAQTLQITGATLGGTDAGDFAISGANCSGRRLAFAQSCTIQARFTPATTGTRTAQLTLIDNEPSATSITLSGSGVAPSSGPAGPQGATGATGPAGATGSVPLKIRLVSCRKTTKTIRRDGHKRRVQRRTCKTQVIRVSAELTATAARAKLRRGRVVYARGRLRQARLTLHTRRPLRRGRYTLILRHRDGPRWITSRRTITIA